MSGIAHLQQENIRLQRNLDNALQQLQQVQHERDSFCALAQSWETTATRYREERNKANRRIKELERQVEQLRAANEELRRVLSGEDEQEYNVLDTLDPVQLGHYITHFRELRGLSYVEVASALSCDSEHVEHLEKGEIRPKASEIVKLASLFECQMYELLNGPYPEATDEELMAQLVRGEISESQAAYRMKIDRLDVRRRLEEDEQS